MNKYGWLAVTLLGTAISFYGNSKVQKAVKEEAEVKHKQVIIQTFNQAKQNAKAM